MAEPHTVMGTSTDDGKELRTAADVLAAAPATVTESTPIIELFTPCSQSGVAVAVTDAEGKLIGVVPRARLLAVLGEPMTPPRPRRTSGPARPSRRRWPVFRLPLGDWVDSAVDWLQTHLAWLFDAISSIVSNMFDGIAAVLSAPAPLLFAGIVAVIAWWLRGLLAGVLAFVGFAVIDSVELWDEAMDTLTLVLVATIIALVLAVPLGIWASRSKTVSAVTRPVLDFMQTMPAMVYLIPGVIFFGVGVVPGIIATIIFSLPPGVRMTELGIRQVDGELVEAAEAFGTTKRNTLLRVQLPLALPTIMAGINQVIMLGLSMVVIAGMVGGGGLGGAVYRAIGNVDVGLGFEAGISIVIVAMYLDRMTGALGREVSPLARRALAKAQSMAAWPEDLEPPSAARGRGLRCGRPRARRGRPGHLRLLRLGREEEHRRRFGHRRGQEDQHGLHPVGRGHRLHLPLEGDAGTARLRGRRQAVREPGALYTGMANGQIDFETDSWLPVTHASYWKKYKDNLEDMGSWYGPTSLELAVPSYMKDVQSLEDLKGKGSQFKGRIVGIEPSAGETGLLKDKILPGYGLDKEYKVVDGSTPSMLAELKRSYAKKEPIVVPLWSPHWAYNQFELTKLKDPKNLWGKGDGIHTLARKGFSADNPEVGSWLKNFKMTEDQLTSPRRRSRSPAPARSRRRSAPG